MRTIKFRGRDFAGLWHHGDLIHDDENLLIRFGGCANAYIENETMGQFTGLFDSNGKNIFEGDILQCPSVPNIPLEVRYNTMQGAFCLVEHTHTDGALLGTCPLGEMLRHYPDMSVIGNVFDNPSLISDKR